jgi:hypothetical protein
MRFLHGWWKSETACKLVAPYNDWTIAFLCQLYVILLCFTPSEPFILHDFVTNQHEIGLDHDLLWVYWSWLMWFIVWAEQDIGCLGVVVGGSSVEQRTYSAQQMATHNVAGNALLAFGCGKYFWRVTYWASVELLKNLLQMVFQCTWRGPYSG